MSASPCHRTIAGSSTVRATPSASTNAATSHYGPGVASWPAQLEVDIFVAAHASSDKRVGPGRAFPSGLPHAPAPCSPVCSHQRSGTHRCIYVTEKRLARALHKGRGTVETWGLIDVGRMAQ